MQHVLTLIQRELLSALKRKRQTSEREREKRETKRGERCTGAPDDVIVGCFFFVRLFFPFRVDFSLFPGARVPAARPALTMQRAKDLSAPGRGHGRGPRRKPLASPPCRFFVFLRARNYSRLALQGTSCRSLLIGVCSTDFHFQSAFNEAVNGRRSVRGFNEPRPEHEPKFEQRVRFSMPGVAGVCRVSVCA